MASADSATPINTSTTATAANINTSPSVKPFRMIGQLQPYHATTPSRGAGVVLASRRGGGLHTLHTHPAHTTKGPRFCLSPARDRNDLEAATRTPDLCRPARRPAAGGDAAVNNSMINTSSGRLSRTDPPAPVSPPPIVAVHRGDLAAKHAASIIFSAEGTSTAAREDAATMMRQKSRRFTLNVSPPRNLFGGLSSSDEGSSSGPSSVSDAAMDVDSSIHDVTPDEAAAGVSYSNNFFARQLEYNLLEYLPGGRPSRKGPLWGLPRPAAAGSAAVADVRTSSGENFLTLDEKTLLDDEKKDDKNSAGQNPSCEASTVPHLKEALASSIAPRESIARAGRSLCGLAAGSILTRSNLADTAELADEDVASCGSHAPGIPVLTATPGGPGGSPCKVLLEKKFSISEKNDFLGGGSMTSKPPPKMKLLPPPQPVMNASPTEDGVVPDCNSKQHNIVACSSTTINTSAAGRCRNYLQESATLLETQHIADTTSSLGEECSPPKKVHASPPAPLVPWLSSDVAPSRGRVPAPVPIRVDYGLEDSGSAEAGSGTPPRCRTPPPGASIITRVEERRRETTTGVDVVGSIEGRVRGVDLEERISELTTLVLQIADTSTSSKNITDRKRAVDEEDGPSEDGAGKHAVIHAATSEEYPVLREGVNSGKAAESEKQSSGPWVAGCEDLVAGYTRATELRVAERWAGFLVACRRRGLLATAFRAWAEGVAGRKSVDYETITHLLNKLRRRASPRLRHTAPSGLGEHKASEEVEQKNAAIMEDDVPSAATFAASVATVEPLQVLAAQVKERNRQLYTPGTYGFGRGVGTAFLAVIQFLSVNKLSNRSLASRDSRRGDTCSLQYCY